MIFILFLNLKTAVNKSFFFFFSISMDPNYNSNSTLILTIPSKLDRNDKEKFKKLYFKTYILVCYLHIYVFSIFRIFEILTTCDIKA